MPKRVGYLYDKMVDRDFIRSVIQEAATAPSEPLSHFVSITFFTTTLRSM